MNASERGVEMKKHLIMIVGGYYPEPSPTGKCADQYISLLEDEFDISVICIGKKHNYNYCFRYENKKVYALYNWRIYFEYRSECLGKESKSEILKIISRFGVIIFKGIGWLQGKFYYPNNLRWFYLKAVKEIEAVHKEKTADVIFSVSAPFSAHLAADKFKTNYPDIKWVTYSVDSYAAQNKGTKKYDKAVLLEKKVLSNADLNLSSAEIIKSSPFLFQMQKPIELPYLLDLSLYDKIGVSRNSQPVVLYAGRFYKKIRNPDFMMRLLVKINGITVKLYTQGECMDIIEPYIKNMPDKFIMNDMVNLGELSKIYTDADILLSIGNNTSEFQPSKIYEMISTGKPILHFYYDGFKDRILEQYSLAFQCKIGDDGCYDEVQKFINDYSYKRANKEIINSTFESNTAEAIKKILKDAINKNCGLIY